MHRGAVPSALGGPGHPCGGHRPGHVGLRLPPHRGIAPPTRQHLRPTFANLTEHETTQILTTNAAEVYGFDLEALAPLAEQHCPTKAEMAAPIDYAKIPERAKGCPGMNPLSQIQPAA